MIALNENVLNSTLTYQSGSQMVPLFRSPSLKPLNTESVSASSPVWSVMVFLSSSYISQPLTTSLM